MIRVDHETPLTDRQAQVLQFLRDFMAANKYPPSLRETAKHFEMSIHGAFCHLTALRRKGRITWRKGRWRSMRIATPRGPCAACLQPLPRRRAA